MELSFQFSLEIIRYAKILIERHDYEIGRQLIRCGTSIGANVKEAQNGESKSDFRHKMKIALKEADETEYWLLLVREIYNDFQLQKLLDHLLQIIKLLNKIISTTTKSINTR